MTWVKIDDAAPHHPKIQDAGVEAFGFWVAMLCYSNRMTTDCVILKRHLAAIWPGTHHLLIGRLTRKLSECGMINQTKEGWLLVNYSRYQKEATSEARDAKREYDRRKQDERRSALRDVNEMSNIDQEVSHRPVKPSRPVPSRPDLLREKEIKNLERARALNSEPFEDAPQSTQIVKTSEGSGHAENARQRGAVFDEHSVAECISTVMRTIGGVGSYDSIYVTGTHRQYVHDVVRYFRSEADHVGDTPRQLCCESVAHYLESDFVQDMKKTGRVSMTAWFKDPASNAPWSTNAKPKTLTPEEYHRANG